MLEDVVQTSSYANVELNDQDLIEISNIIQAQFPVTDFYLSQSTKTFSLSGIDSTKAALTLNNILHNLRVANYPLLWEEKLTMLNDPNYKIKRYQLDKNSAEFKHIELELHKSHKAAIIKIVRI